MHGTTTSLVLALAMGITSATPVMQFPRGEDLLKRQAPGDVKFCVDNQCGGGNCPYYASLGSGFPDCPAYPTDQLEAGGYETNDSGQLIAYVDFPQPDPGCKFIIRSPVTQRQGINDCGAITSLVENAACQAITLTSSVLTQFCCGTGDCTAAGSPFAASSASYVLRRSDTGEAIEPTIHSVKGKRSLTALEKKSLMPASPASPLLHKRACEFTVTVPAYDKAAGSQPVSDVVSCPTDPNAACDITLNREVTQQWEASVSVTVGDPLGIISATAGFSFSESKSRSFSGTFSFTGGQRGYVSFTPILKCVQGYWTGDCDEGGQVFEACSPVGSPDPTGEMRGDLRGVVVST